MILMKSVRSFVLQIIFLMILITVHFSCRKPFSQIKKNLILGNQKTLGHIIEAMV